MFELVFGLAFPLVVLSFLWLVASLYLIKEHEVGLVEKKVFGGRLAPGRVIAANGEQGLQASTLTPGLHFLPMPFFKITRIGLIDVPQGMIATLSAVDGSPLRTGQLLGQSVSGHQH